MANRQSAGCPPAGRRSRKPVKRSLENLLMFPWIAERGEQRSTPAAWRRDAGRVPDQAGQCLDLGQGGLGDHGLLAAL